MFKLKLENSRILKGIIDALSNIIDETEFEVTPEGFSITAMDPSRICLLQLSIENEDFDEFECDKEITVGINLDDINKILNRSSSDDSIEIKYEDEDNKLRIVMEKEGMSRKRTFSLALLDIEMEEIPMDNLLQIEYPSTFRIDPDFLVEAIKDAEIYSEILRIKAEEGNGLEFSSSGQIGEMTYNLGLEDLIETHLEDKNVGSYSLTFLKAILKLSSITEALEVSLKTDHPLKMDYNILEGGILNYFLAPRVEETEEYEDDDMDEF